MKRLFVFSVIFLTFSYVHAKETPISVKSGTCSLEGTLLTPDTDKKVPLVIFIAGSGPTDRDCNQPRMKTNSYKMLAEELQNQGIASLRFDKRGIAASKCEDIKEENMRFDDFIDDVRVLVDFAAKDKRFSKIILCGHSEGSLIGMNVAETDKRVKGFVSLAGIGRSVDIVLKEQLSKQPEAISKPADAIIDSLKSGMLCKDIPAVLNGIFRPSIQPYMISWMSYIPTDIIAKLKCPVLIIQGENDIQVSVEDAKALHGAAPKSKIVLIPSMTHTLKDSKGTNAQTQLFAYIDPNLALNPKVAEEIVEFVK